MLHDEAMKSLYQRILGEAFEKLPTALREFHQTGKGVALGTMTVRRPSGRFRNWLSDLLMLPAACEAVPLRLEVISVGRQERWMREFGGQRLETIQWEEDGLLVEQAGPGSFVFALRADSEGMDFHMRHQRAGILRLPVLLAVKVHARVTGRPAGWHVSVRISSGVFGELTTYEADVFPQKP